MIVEGMGLLRGALRAVLSSEDDLEVVADVADYDKIVPEVCQGRPDVVVVDMGLPGCDLPALVTRLGVEAPDCVVLPLSTRTGPEALREAVRSGLRGLVSKDLPPAELIKLVRAVADGEPVDPVVEAGILQPSDPANPLSRREREVLRVAAEGVPLKEIARQLFLAHGTVRNHLSSILRKTGTRNRLEAVRRAQQDGWL